MASSGRPVSSPTFSYGSSGPPCVAMTAFIVSTTRRTLSVSVPSRSQRTARSGGPLAAATARGPGDDRLGDGQGDLFGDSAIASHLANAHEGRKLVVERVDVFQPRVDDLEAEVRQRVAFREALEHHLADPSGRDLGCATLPDRGLELVDEAIDLFARQRLRCGLPDRARELPPVELLAAAVALQDVDAGGLAPRKGGESLLTPVADPPPPDGIAVLGLARVDDARVGVAAGGALHRHKIWDRVPPNLVARRCKHLADRVCGVKKDPPVAGSDAATAHKQPALVDLYDGPELRRALQETRSHSIVECRERSFGVLRVDMKGAVERLVA